MAEEGSKQVSLVLPNLYHWSPVARRGGITRYGLKPTCPTSVPIGVRLPGGAREVDPEASAFCVCLGTSPSHAWSLSAGVWGTVGNWYDCWQVTLAEEDEVHPLPFYGYRLEEIRVNNRIPKARVWHIGTRQVKHGRH